MQNFRLKISRILSTQRGKLQMKAGCLSPQSRCSAAELAGGRRKSEIEAINGTKLKTQRRTAERPHHVEKVIMIRAAGEFSSLSRSLPAQLAAPPPLAYQSPASRLIDCTKISIDIQPIAVQIIANYSNYPSSQKPTKRKEAADDYKQEPNQSCISWRKR